MSSQTKMETERLIIRPLKTTDAAALSVLRSDPEVGKYIQRPATLSPTDALTAIIEKKDAVSRGEICYWALTLKPDDVLIGTTCLFNFDDERMEAEIGYEIAAELQGKGLISEAVNAVLNYAFYDRKRLQVVAYSMAENTASVNLLKKFGFVRDDGRSKRAEHFDVFLKQIG